LVPSEQLTGKYAPTTKSFSGYQKVRVKLPSVRLLGIPLSIGANCQSAQASQIPLNSVGSFGLATGGTLAGAFSISNLAGCGVLSGVVSPLTAGGGNAIALKLTGK
ncbi:MAG: hypothetical protein AAGC46_19895, partial [Solirubrobacteraceae bacterium]